MRNGPATSDHASAFEASSGRFARDVIEDKRAGTRAGVRGTPMFFINGALLADEGYSMQGIREALESALERN